MLGEGGFRLLVDSCEVKYAWSSHIAEFGNTLSAVAMIAIHLLCVWNVLLAKVAVPVRASVEHRRVVSLFPRFGLISAAFFVYGIANAALHSGYEAHGLEQLEQFSRLLCATLILYTLFSEAGRVAELVRRADRAPKGHWAKELFWRIINMDFQHLLRTNTAFLVVVLACLYLLMVVLGVAVAAMKLDKFGRGILPSVVSWWLTEKWVVEQLFRRYVMLGRRTSRQKNRFFWFVPNCIGSSSVGNEEFADAKLPPGSGQTQQGFSAACCTSVEEIADNGGVLFRLSRPTDDKGGKIQLDESSTRDEEQPPSPVDCDDDVDAHLRNNTGMIRSSAPVDMRLFFVSIGPESRVARHRCFNNVVGFSVCIYVCICILSLLDNIASVSGLCTTTSKGLFSFVFSKIHALAVHIFGAIAFNLLLMGLVVLALQRRSWGTGRHRYIGGFAVLEPGERETGRGGPWTKAKGWRARIMTRVIWGGLFNGLEAASILVLGEVREGAGGENGGERATKKTE